MFWQAITMKSSMHNTCSIIAVYIVLGSLFSYVVLAQHTCTLNPSQLSECSYSFGGVLSSYASNGEITMPKCCGLVRRLHHDPGDASCFCKAINYNNMVHLESYLDISSSISLLGFICGVRINPSFQCS
ncbi:hypothetical protein LIER_43865 [Lithospermum erythrorhizon]|uniref:Hydrophobic seed protein domain-containing protein n=1 Tax=Lithospermum erythrorhizon TaxID=34254 RepID=A0AAV3R3W7_LITER